MHRFKDERCFATEKVAWNTFSRWKSKSKRVPLTGMLYIRSLWAKSFRDIRNWSFLFNEIKKFLASRIIKKIFPIFMIDESFNNSSRIQFMILIKHPCTTIFFSFCAIQDSKDDPIKSEWNFSTLSRDISDINNPRIRGKTRATAEWSDGSISTKKFQSPDKWTNRNRV